MSDNKPASDDSLVFFLLEDDKKSEQIDPGGTLNTDALKLEEIADDEFSIELDLQKFGIITDERRNDARIPYWGKVFIHDKETHKTIKALAKDITKKGIGLTLPMETLTVGKEVIIEFPGSGSLKAFSVDAEVVTATKREGRYILGFQVTHMSTLTHRKIQDYIEETTSNDGFSDIEIT